MFPNPTSSSVRIEVDAAWNGAQASVYDVQGKEVWHGMLTSGLTLDVTSWNPGTYFLATTDDQGHTLSRTLVVK